MKKFEKKILKIIPILIISFIMISSVFATISPNLPAPGNNIVGITDIGAKIWNTTKVVVQILAITFIIVAGVRYMYASADVKADIKKQTIILVLGAILVFAAVPVAQFVSDAAKQVLP